MHLSRSRYALAITYILAFTLCLAACNSAPQHPQATGKGKDSFDCGDKTVGLWCPPTAQLQRMFISAKETF